MLVREARGATHEFNMTSHNFTAIQSARVSVGGSRPQLRYASLLFS